MRRALVVALAAVAGCRDLQRSYDACVASGRCSDVGGGGEGGGAATGGGNGGGSAGGGSAGGGSAGGGSAGGGSAGGGSAGGGQAANTVIIRQFERHVPEASRALIDVPTKVAPAGVWLKTGGGYTLLLADPSDSGVYVVHGVPPDAGFLVEVRDFYPFLLEPLRTFFDTSLRDVDLSQYVLGRPDTIGVLPDSGTLLYVDAGNLQAWNRSADVLIAGSPAAGLGTHSLMYYPADPIPAGATSFGNVTNWGFVRPPNLIQQSRGDLLYLYQFSAETSPDGGATWGTVARQATSSTLEMIAGQTASLAIDLVPIAQNRQFKLNYHLPRGDWLPYLDDLCPGSHSEPSYNVTAAATPASPEKGRLFSPPGIYGSSLPSFKVDGGAGPFDSWVESTARTPYPLSWSTLVTVRQTAGCLFHGRISDGGVFASQVNNESMGAIVPIADLASADGGFVRLTPRLSPPRDPVVNGRVTWVTSSWVRVPEPVTLSWAAPTFGTPTRYEVLVTTREWSEQFQLMVAHPVGRFITTGTELTLPPGVAQLGKQHSYEVTAIYAPVADPAAPLLSSAPQHEASSVTDVFFVTRPDGGE